MTIRLSDLGQVFLVCGKTDMRQGIDSLAYLVKSQFNLDPFQVRSISSAEVEKTDSKLFTGMNRDFGYCINVLKMGNWPGQTMKKKSRL